MRMIEAGDESERHQLILKLLTRLRCAECGKPYEPEDFVLVNRWQNVWVLGVECCHCGGSGYVVIAMQFDEEPKPEIGPLPEEVDRTKVGSPLTADDVLDMHLFLEEFDGDFENIWAE